MATIQFARENHVRQRWLERSNSGVAGQPPDTAVREAWCDGVPVGLPGRRGSHRLYPPEDVVVAMHQGAIRTVLDASLIHTDDMNTQHLKTCPDCGEFWDARTDDDCPWCGGDE